MRISSIHLSIHVYNTEISNQLETKGLRKLQRLEHTETIISASGTRVISSVFFKKANHLIACPIWMRTLGILFDFATFTVVIG